MTEWADAFRQYAKDRFGDRYKYGEIDPDWLTACKLAFRAGYRSAANAESVECTHCGPVSRTRSGNLEPGPKGAPDED